MFGQLDNVYLLGTFSLGYFSRKTTETLRSPPGLYSFQELQASVSSELPVGKRPKNDIEPLIFPTLTPEFRGCRDSPLRSVCTMMKTKPRALCMLGKYTANLAAARFSVSVPFLVAKIKYLTRSTFREKVWFEIAVQKVPVLDEAGLATGM